MTEWFLKKNSDWLVFKHDPPLDPFWLLLDLLIFKEIVSLISFWSVDSAAIALPRVGEKAAEETNESSEGAGPKCVHRFVLCDEE